MVKINKKIMLLILAVCMILPSLTIVPASAAVNAGDIYNYEIIKNGGDGKSVLDKVTNEPLSRAAVADGYIFDFSFTNVKQYITSNGATESCTSFYFRATSNNADLVQVGYTPVSSETTAAAFSADGAEVISTSKSYLSLKVPQGTATGGVAVINVWVSTLDPACAPENSLRKTFTIKMVDDSRNGEIDIKVKQGTSPMTNNNISIFCDGSYTTLNIDQIIGHDFSGGVNSTTEKLITYYTWTATNSNDAIVDITDASNPDDAAGDAVTGKVEASAGNKSIKITPLQPGTATVTINVVPDPQYKDANGDSRYKTDKIEITIEVKGYTGDISFTAKPDKDLYGFGIDDTDPAPETVDVSFSISDLEVNINGNNTPVSASENIHFEFTNTDNLKCVTGSDNTSTTVMDFQGKGESQDYKFDVILTPKMENGKTVLTYSTEFLLRVSNDDYTRTVSKTTITFNLYDGSKDGEIYDFIITQVGLEDTEKSPGGKKTIADKEAVYGYVDKNGKAQENLEFYVSGVRVYDTDSESEDYLRTITNSDEYTLTVNSDSTGQKYINPYVSDNLSDYKKLDSIFTDAYPFIVTPKAVYSTGAKVSVTVSFTDEKAGVSTTRTKSREFSVKINNKGVFIEDEGNIVKIDIISSISDKKTIKETIYEGKTFYLKNDLKNALKIDISKVYAADASKPSASYMSELKNYEWTIEISGNDTASANNKGIPPNPNKGDGTSDYDTKYIYMDGNTFTQNGNNYIYSERVLASNTSSVKSVEFSTGWYPTIWGEGYSEDSLSVKLIVMPLDEGGTAVSGKKGSEVSFTIYTSEMGGRFLPVINYENEVITIAEYRTFVIDPATGEKIYEDSDYKFDNEEVKETGAPKYMYCLKAVADGASQTSEKWYPFYGSEIDIAKYIPKTENAKPYRIAVRRADAIADENNSFASGIRVATDIPGRKALSSTDKKKYAYDNGKIAYKGSDTVKVDYRIGISGWNSDAITSADGIQVLPSLNPVGNTVEIKIAADPENKKFSTVSFKVKVPKASKKPLIKDDGKKKFSGFSNKQVWSATPDAETWKICPKGSIPYGNLETAFPDLISATIDGEEYYLLYVKTSATNKAAESEVTIVPIPAASYKTQ